MLLRCGQAFVVLASALICMLGIQPTKAGVFKTTVFESGTEGYSAYRIPTITKAANGDLLAIAEGRKNGLSDTGDIDLVMKRSTDNGKTWSPLQLIQDEYATPNASITIGNPAPVVDAMDAEHPGRIWLAFTRNTSRMFMLYSDDSGATWSDRTEITSAVKDSSWSRVASGPVHGIQLTRGTEAGRLVIPSWHQSTTGFYGSHIVYSDDHGQSWQLGAAQTDIGDGVQEPNESFAIELVSGELYWNARDQGSAAGTRSVAISADGGLSLQDSLTPDSAIVSPVVQNSGLRFYATDSGDSENLLLYSAPFSASSRVNMTIRMSTDEGQTWVGNTQIHSGPSAYSDMVKIDPNYLGILYEAGSSLYDEIVFGFMDVADLNPSPWNGVIGDVNQDGGVNYSDMEAFIANWTPVSNEYYLGGVDNYKHSDLNFDGVNDLHDVYIMRNVARYYGLSQHSLDAMLGVPEPRAQEIIGLCFVACLCTRKVRFYTNLNSKFRWRS